MQANLSNKAFNTLLIKQIKQLEAELGDCPKVQELDVLLIELKDQLKIVKQTTKRVKQ